MAKLKNLDHGWRILVKEKITRCARCGEPMSPPFFYCEEKDEAYCDRCEKNAFRPCHSLKEVHEHFNITKQEVEDE